MARVTRALKSVSATGTVSLFHQVQIAANAPQVTPCRFQCRHPERPARRCPHALQHLFERALGMGELDGAIGCSINAFSTGAHDREPIDKDL